MEYLQPCVKKGKFMSKLKKVVDTSLALAPNTTCGVTSTTKRTNPDGSITTTTEVKPSYSGAVKGALAGAAAGSIIPGVGTAIGGAVGGLIGLVFGPAGDTDKSNKDSSQ